MTTHFADLPAAGRLARQLADTLAASGDITDPRWHAIFSRVPRHAFVPHFARTEQTSDDPGARCDFLVQARR
ncbi:MAG TPA: hypothetical protein VFQ44_21595 [Streptosporangiaceae bacterium]|nr:hypothetical protein [Streptosporangiaceae bacterium]